MAGWNTDRMADARTGSTPLTTAPPRAATDTVLGEMGSYVAYLFTFGSFSRSVCDGGCHRWDPLPYPWVGVPVGGALTLPLS